MARAFPDPMPEYVRENPIRRAEVRVYDALKADLPSAFAVFYSSPWLGVTADGRELDGEADFVIAHEALGLLIIEVKGGSVSRDGVTGQWRTKDVYGIVHKIKNPVEQAKQSKYELLKKLKGSVKWHNRFVRLRHGVILPDSERPRQDLGPDMPLSIFAFEDDMKYLGKWIEQRMSSVARDEPATDSPLGRDGIAAVEQLLARSFVLRTPLRSSFAQEEHRILLLTEEQFHILGAFEEHTRVAIAGGAGTGKTALALEKATRLANGGQQILLTCYSRPLAEYLRHAAGSVEGLTIKSFHEVCAKFARMAGIDVNVKSTGVDAPQYTTEFFSSTLPEALISSMELFPAERYDGIIVDEGQDFVPEWWVALQLCLKDPESGLLYVFYDDNQRVGNGRAALPEGLPEIPYRLTRNLRNTKSIFDASLCFYGGKALVAAGPEGRPVQWVEKRAKDSTLDTLSSLIGILIKTENIPLDDIAVLFSTTQGWRSLVTDGTIGKLPVCAADARRNGALVVDTVRRFKGLESRVVLLVHPGDMLDDPELLYVALTRARLHLIVVGDRPELDAVRLYNTWRTRGRVAEPVTNYPHRD